MKRQGRRVAASLVHNSFAHFRCGRIADIPKQFET